MKRVLFEANIAYTEIDLSNPPKGARQYNAAPVLEIKTASGVEVIHGYDPQKMKTLLQEALPQ